MEGTSLTEMAEQWTHMVLVWIGFGTVVGLLAKAIMPGRDPGGAVGTLVMGIGGVVIGCGALAFFMGERVSPISTLGFAVAIGGAFTILCLYRILAGYWFTEGEGPVRRRRRRYGWRRYMAWD